MLLHDTARLLARYEGVERRLFEVFGRWSMDTEQPDVARLFAEQAHHHAWHAELWAERRPVLHDLDASTLELPVTGVLGAGVEDGVDRLSVLAEGVLPELVGIYEAHLAASDPVADGPVIRALRLVTADENADWRAARSLLAALAPEGAGAERSVARQSIVAALVAPLR